MNHTTVQIRKLPGLSTTFPRHHSIDFSSFPVRGLRGSSRKHRTPRLCPQVSFSSVFLGYHLVVTGHCFHPSPPAWLVIHHGGDYSSTTKACSFPHTPGLLVSPTSSPCVFWLNLLQSRPTREPQLVYTTPTSSVYITEHHGGTITHGDGQHVQG